MKSVTKSQYKCDECGITGCVYLPTLCCRCLRIMNYCKVCTKAKEETKND